MEFLPVAPDQAFFPGFPLFKLRQFSPLTTYVGPTARPPQPRPKTKWLKDFPSPKPKVVFVLGSTGTGKSKLAIDLALQFDGEVVNSDKMQVYSGLNIITNKVTNDECAGVPHHLIGGVHPDTDFTASDFRRKATSCVESILARNKLPIIAGGSNSYIKELVEGDGGWFRRKYACCFIWIDVELGVLHGFVAERVDRMVEMGLVEEAREFFDRDGGDYSRGIRRSIGVPEMDRYFREENDDEVLREAIEEIKTNTCHLTRCQLEKIRRLAAMWDVRRVDATEAFVKRGCDGEKVWERVAKEPSVEIVNDFLKVGAGSGSSSGSGGAPTNAECKVLMTSVFAGATACS